MVKSLHHGELPGAGREWSFCRPCVELLAACVKIDRNTSIPQSLLATLHPGEAKTPAVSSSSLESSWGQRASACLHSGQWNVLGKVWASWKTSETFVDSGAMDPS